MKRLPQLLLVGSFLPLCWLGMMAVHELGHVLAAWASGGQVTGVVLHPLAISRTDVSPNPRPLIVVWCGPLLGVLLPLVVWGLWRWLHAASAYLWRFFAGFCLIANGAYIGIGSFEGIGDAGVMRQAGSPVWLLWLFGAVCIPLGLRLWHGLGSHFGLGHAAGEVDRNLALLSVAGFVTLLLLTAFTSQN